ncbi:MAG: hypothetical protein ACRDAQ_09990 [Cetobacterium sp.]
MLNKIKGMFKSEELEQELEELRIKCDFLKRNEIKRASAYDILLKENVEVSKKKLDLEMTLNKERERIENLKNEYVEKIVFEMDSTKKFKIEKENLEKESLEKSREILKLKEEFQKIENAYSEEYAKRLKAKLKIYEDTCYTKIKELENKFENDLLSTKNEYSLYFEKEKNKWISELQASEEKVKIEESNNLKKSEELEELKLKLSLESSKFESDFLAENKKWISELEKSNSSSKSIVDSLKKELKASEKKARIEEFNNLNNLKKYKELEELNLKLSLEISKFESELLAVKTKLNLELKKSDNSSKSLVNSLKRELKISEEKVRIEKSNNLKKSKELEELELKLILEKFKFERDLLAEKSKMSLELEKSMDSSKSIVESLEKDLEVSEYEEKPEVPTPKLEKEILNDEKIEEYNFKGNWANKEKFFKNKNGLVDLMKSFNENDFKEMYSEGKKRGLLKIVKDRDFSNVLTRLKLKLPLTIMSLEKLEVFYENLMKDIYIDKDFESNSNVLEEKVENNLKEEKEVNEFNIEYYLKDQNETFEDIFNEGLKSGFVNMEDLKKINFEYEDDVYDIYEAIEIMEDRGVRINY